MIAPRTRRAVVVSLALSASSAVAVAQPAPDAATPTDAAVTDAAVSADATAIDAAAPADASVPADAAPQETPAEVPSPAAAQPTPPQPEVAPPPRRIDGPRTVVIDAAPIGVDPGAGTFVSNLLRARVAELGFDVIPTPEFYDAARQLQLPFPVPPEGVYMLERALRAPVAVTAEVRAAQGRYVVRLRVRVAIEPEERVRDVSATQWELAQALRDALPDMLRPPELGEGTHPVEPVAQTPAPAPVPVRRRRRVRAHRYHWEVGGGAIVALGPGRDGFANALVAARVGWFPQDRLGFSITAAYANLRARNDERASNVLLLAGVETAVDLWPARHIFIPLRAEVGYLPNNGPVFRLTAGLSFQLARRVRLEVDLLSPTLWVLPESSPVSLDLGVTLHVGL